MFFRESFVLPPFQSMDRFDKLGFHIYCVLLCSMGHAEICQKRKYEHAEVIFFLKVGAAVCDPPKLQSVVH